MQADGLLTMQEVSRILNVPVKTLKRWRQNNEGPHSFRIGPRQIRYRPESVERYIEEQEEESA